MSNKNEIDTFPEDKEYNLWLLLSQTRSAIFRARQEKLGHYLHPNQALALCTIWAYKGRATPAIISRSLFLERHSVSELISRMEEKGLVKKNRDINRKNVVRVSITDKGRQVGHHVMQREFINNIISNLDEEQQEQLKTSLDILLQAAQKTMGTAAEHLQGPDKT